jgi:hypothetical protein
MVRKRDDLETVSIARRPEPVSAVVFVMLGEATFSVDVPTSGTLGIGRGDDCDVRIDHRSISRRHAILHTGDPMSIEDLGSRNGTIVRGSRVQPKSRTPLHIGDVIECGEAMLVMRPRRPSAMASERADGLRVGPEARWFESELALRVNLGRRGALRRILDHLVERRIEAPDRGISVAEMLEAGWPGERMQWEAGVARVYTTVQRLRALGLSDILVTRDDGYLIDPTVTVERV